MTVVDLTKRDEDFVREDRRAVLLKVVERSLGRYANLATISPEQLAEVLGIGRSAGYQLCREGRVPTLRVGRSVRVPVPALAALLLGVEP